MRDIRVIIARNNFGGVNCVIISERRVLEIPFAESISVMVEVSNYVDINQNSWTNIVSNWGSDCFLRIRCASVPSWDRQLLRKAFGDLVRAMRSKSTSRIGWKYIGREICTFPKGPKIEKIQSHLKISISIESFNLDLQNSPQKKSGLVGGSLELFNLAWKFQSRRAILNFFNLWALSIPPSLPFESKLLPAVLLLLRIYFPIITVTVTVLKFGWITITVTVLAPAVAPSFPLTPNYRLESHLT